MRTRRLYLSAAAAILVFAMAGCGGGGGAASPAPTPTPAQTTAALQGIWQTPAGASSSVSAIALPDGQLWSVVSSSGVTRLVKATLVAQATGFAGTGKSYILGSGTISNVAATATATVVEKTSLVATITPGGGQPEAFSLAYQSRHDTPAALTDFAGAWQGTLGPGTLNWVITAAGTLTGTRTTGCTYTGQLNLRPDRKAVVDVTISENCAGTVTQLMGVAAMNADKTGISMAALTADEAAAVVLTLAH